MEERKERNYKTRISEEEAIMRSLKHKGIRSGEQWDERMDVRKISRG
jgi:hypothetical protein